MTYLNKLINISTETLNFYKNQYKILYNFSLFLSQSIPKYIQKININFYEIEIYTSLQYLIAILFFLKNNINCQFKQLVDIIAYDILGRTNRFTIIYALLSIQYNVRISVLITTNELLPISSVSSLYNSAFWLEREVWDLYGIFFYNHPDLRRILTDYGFDGHPLRKDFPLTGFVEIFYDDSKKRIVYENVSLAQEYRNFNFKNPWLD